MPHGGVIDVPYDQMPSDLIFAVGWHITPMDAFIAGATAMELNPDLSCLLLTFIESSTFICDAWVIRRKSKWQKFIDAFLGVAILMIFILAVMLTGG